MFQAAARSACPTEVVHGMKLLVSWSISVVPDRLPFRCPWCALGMSLLTWCLTEHASKLLMLLMCWLTHGMVRAS